MAPGGGITNASLAGLVYTDSNNDGILNGNEAGLSGVTVRLDGTDIDGAIVELSTVTGSVKSTSTGRTSMLSNPITAAATSADPRLRTSIPPMTLATNIRAAAYSSHLTASLIMTFWKRVVLGAA